MLICFI